MTCEYLTTEQAAAFLGLTASTLNHWRMRGGGPAFRKHGRRVLYRPEDLRAWSDAQRRESTSTEPEQVPA